MPTVSIDTYAATNPAFCSLVLHAFINGYVESDPAGVPLPLVILPLPIVLTEQIATSMGPTNIKTGLLPWVVRSQEVFIGLSERITKTAAFSRKALLFGLRYRIISITVAGRLIPDKAGLSKQPNFPVSSDTGRAMSLAKRLGAWMGQVEQLDTIFISLGINR